MSPLQPRQIEEGTTMNQTVEEYQTNESEENTSWIWSKALSIGKKFLAAGVIVSSGPLLVPALVFVATIAILAWVPYCLFLANYACTQKLMGSLLPTNDETSGSKYDESEFEHSKVGHGDVDKPRLIEIEEDEEIAKESTTLVERLKDEGRTDKRTSEELGNAKSEKLQDQIGKPETRHDEEEHGDTKTESMGKDGETSSKELTDQAESASHGTGEEKPKNATKRKKKTGRAGA